jgi:hypothetical protein
MQKTQNRLEYENGIKKMKKFFEQRNRIRKPFLPNEPGQTQSSFAIPQKQQ